MGKEYLTQLFKLKKIDNKFFMKEERLLFDLVTKRFWKRHKDTPTAILNTRVINGETWIEYDYAMDLIVEEFKEEGIDIEETEDDIEADPCFKVLNKNAEMLHKLKEIRREKNE